MSLTFGNLIDKSLNMVGEDRTTVTSIIINSILDGIATAYKEISRKVSIISNPCFVPDNGIIDTSIFIPSVYKVFNVSDFNNQDIKIPFTNLYNKQIKVSTVNHDVFVNYYPDYDLKLSESYNPTEFNDNYNLIFEYKALERLYKGLKQEEKSEYYRTLYDTEIKKVNSNIGEPIKFRNCW